MKKTKLFLKLITLLLPAMPTQAKAQQHNMADMKGMQVNDTTMNMQMNSGFSLNLPMNRDGSGTAWLPDASPNVWPDGKNPCAGEVFLRIYPSLMK